MRLTSLIETMRSFDRPWFICGGWAIDLFIGRATRPHHDVDVGVFRCDQLALRDHLLDWVLEVAPGDGTLRTWEEDEFLEPPLHCLWGRRQNGLPGQLEVLLNERADGCWEFRRDREVKLPLEKAVREVPMLMGREQQVPILAPEIVLLYKARRPQKKDTHDLQTCLSAFSDRQLVWLQDAIDKAGYDSGWSETLSDRLEQNKLMTDEMLSM